jgi:hypothetical protein
MTALTAAIGLAAMTVLAAGPAAAAEPGVDPAAAPPANGSFLFDKPKARGVVALTQNGSTMTLRFHLFGLKPDHRYRLVGSAKRCASEAGVLFSRTFRTNARGVAWDPVTYQVDATKVRSVRVKSAATGTTVACVAGATIPVTTDAIAIKVKAEGIRALIVETEPATGGWMVTSSFTGLAPNAIYSLAGKVGTCAAPEGNSWSNDIEANASGREVDLSNHNLSFTATYLDFRLVDAPFEDPPLFCRDVR